MRRTSGTLALSLAASASLGGCVAAVVPLVAGGAIARQELRAEGSQAGPERNSSDSADVEGSVTIADGAYADFALYALQFTTKADVTETDEAENDVSALLVDPASLMPERKPCGEMPLAALIDLDPAGGLMSLDEGGETPDPLLGDHLRQLREADITVVWISDHGPEAAGRIRSRLVRARFDPFGTDSLILMRFAGESKQVRRRRLGESYCLIAIAGDQRADFDELYDYVLDPGMAEPLEAMLGDGWFFAPPPFD